MAAFPGVVTHKSWPAFCLIVFIILSITSLSASVSFSVIGPDQPLVVPPGEDALLTCHLSPQISAEDMTVRWFKGDYLAVVHVYRNRQDWNEEQMAEYKRRTEFITNGIHVGNVSLRIRNVTSSDTGHYSCFFDEGPIYEQTVVELKVAALGSSPHFHLKDVQKGGVQIVCTSSGWYPEPEVLWKDGKGNNLSSSSEVNPPAGGIRFNIKSTHVIDGHSNTLSCCIRNPTLSQWKKSTIHVSDPFLQSLSNCSMERIVIAASFTALVILLGSLAAYYFKQGTGTLSVKIGKLSKELEKLPEELGWRRAKTFAEVVTLDPETAHPVLVLSEERRRARETGQAQTLPDNPKRFTADTCVMGSEGFSSGKHYWEVQVLQDGKGWDVGTARESMIRNEAFGWLPETGVWGLHQWESQYWTRTSPKWTPLVMRKSPRRLGMYLDYEGGQLSIYNADTMEHIYTYTQAAFTERLFPFFCLWTGAELRLV